MSDISNSVLAKEIDHIAAVAKAQAETYTATVDCFDNMVKEQNEDDLLNGTDAAVAVDANLSGGTDVYQQFTNMTAWLAQRAVSAGSASLDALLTARKQRAPYSYNQYVFYPQQGSNMTQANIFYDTAVRIGSFIYGGTYSAGTALTLSGTYNWMAVEIKSATIDAWTVDCTVTYSDDSTGTETVVLDGTETLANQTDVGTQNVDLVALDGATVLPMGATTGFVAGQRVLVHDTTYPIKLEATTATGSTALSIGADQLGFYDTGDGIWVQDDNSTETGTIEDISWRDGTITMSGIGYTGGFSIADDAFIWKSATSGNGWQEMHTIASVSAGQALEFSGALQHTYYTGAAAVRLIKSCSAITTSSGGSADDDIYFTTKSERAIAQA